MINTSIGTAQNTAAYTGATITPTNNVNYIVGVLTAQNGGHTTSVNSISNIVGTAHLVTHVHDTGFFNRDFWVYYFEPNSTNAFNPQWNLNQSVICNSVLFELTPFKVASLKGTNQTFGSVNFKLSVAVVTNIGDALITVGGMNHGFSYTPNAGWSGQSYNSGDSPPSVDYNEGNQSNTQSTSNNFNSATLGGGNFEILALDFSIPNNIITFAETGISSGFGNGVLALNNTIYSVSQLPVVLTYLSGNSSDQITYGFFSSVSGQSLQSVSGCGKTSANGVIIPSVSGTCTITATYTAPTPNGCEICAVIGNQITGFMTLLVPSLIILFIFLFMGLKLGLHGDSLVFLVIVGIGVIFVLGAFLSHSFVPIWVGGISVIFMMVGFVYYKTIQK